MTAPAPWETYLSARETEHLEEIEDFLRIPSVSALPEHAADIRAAAEWLAERLKSMGVPEVELLDGGGSPVVWGRWIVKPGGPVAMIYGHYDVQPPDPIALWETPPFEPTVRDGNLYARGAADDKGSLLATLQAVEALIQKGRRPPVNLSFFLEGEEEISSPSAAAIVASNKERLACAVVISADGVMYGPDLPSLTLSTKGMAKGEIHVRTADADLHSGLYGATVPNAIQTLTQILATLHTPDGAVAVEGFRAWVKEPSLEESAEIGRVPFDEERFLAGIGVKALWGEPGYGPLERLWLRPQLDLNGIWGGFTGEGSKTITPGQAHAKFTCRLVAGQDPPAVIKAIQAHVAAHCPSYAEAWVEDSGGGATAFAIRRDHPTLLAAAATINELTGKEPIRIRLGGTLPVAEVFQRELKAEMVFFAWEMPDNNLHAPNEFVRLSDLRMARRAWCSLLTRIATGPMN